MKCYLCPRKCGIERAGAVGFCGAKALKVGCVMKHFWEEPIISGTRGSGAIFFSHCNMKCCFCQNYQISHEGVGEEISVTRLSQIFKKLEEEGAENINLVTGTHYAEEIIAALEIYRPNIPIVWNSSGYEEPETIERLSPYIDIFIPDLKYYDSDISQKYSSAADYFEKASTIVKTMRACQPQDIIENGLMKKGVIIRHMILPTHIENSKKVLSWAAENLGTETYISLMCQYFPCYKADFPIDRPITPLEYKIVLKHAQKLGFKNGFIQEEGSASPKYVPEFKNKLDFY